MTSTSQARADMASAPNADDAVKLFFSSFVTVREFSEDAVVFVTSTLVELAATYVRARCRPAGGHFYTKFDRIEFVFERKTDGFVLTAPAPVVKFMDAAFDGSLTIALPADGELISWLQAWYEKPLDKVALVVTPRLITLGDLILWDKRTILP